MKYAKKEREMVKFLATYGIRLVKIPDDGIMLHGTADAFARLAIEHPELDEAMSKFLDRAKMVPIQ